MSDPNVKVVEYHRLSVEQFNKIKDKMPMPAVMSEDSPQKVGWLLGIQYCLEHFRKAVVIE